MQLQFLGCGSAFCGPAMWQSNVLVTKNGKRLLIDCGSDVRHALAEAQIPAESIDGVYITHLHADHIGGLEWLAFITYFTPNAKRPKLYGISRLLRNLWNNSLSGGLASVEGRENELSDYFEPIKLLPNNSFSPLKNTSFTPVQTCHIMNGYEIVNSFGLMIRDDNKTIFFTGDTQFAPNQLRVFYDQADIIFHDCETSSFKSGVHAHYTELVTLPLEVKAKMWLYHYQPSQFNAVKDGFAGFVTKGQTFNTEDI